MPNGMAPPSLSRCREFTLAAIPPCRQGGGRRAIGRKVWARNCSSMPEEIDLLSGGGRTLKNGPQAA